MKHPVLLADTGLFFVAVVWGAAFAVLKDTLNTFQPMTLLAVRFAFSAAILSLVFRRRVDRKSTRLNSSHRT